MVVHRTMASGMERRIAAGVLASCAWALAACGDTQGPVAPSGPQVEGWSTPPRIETARRDGTGLMLTGHADPGGRVVLRATGGVAYAVGADEAGRFHVRIAAPATDTLFDVQSQQGEQAQPAPTRLLVTADPAGPIALVALGQASRRLDAAGAVDAIDTDGRARLVSGRATPDAEVAVVADGRTLSVPTDAEGRWTLAVPPGTGPLTVAGVTVLDPGPAPPDGSPSVERLAGGWRLWWRASDEAGQTSWFPAGS
jgi:hypothetical protein